MMGNHWRLVGDWSPIDRRTVADQTIFTKMSPTSLVFDAATNTSRRPNCSDNQFADHRKPPKTTPKKVVVGCRREVVDVILWQPIADWSAIIYKHLPTSDNLRQPPKKVVVRGRRLVVAIVWLGLKACHQSLHPRFSSSIFFWNMWWFNLYNLIFKWITIYLCMIYIRWWRNKNVCTDILNVGPTIPYHIKLS